MSLPRINWDIVYDVLAGTIRTGTFPCDVHHIRVKNAKHDILIQNTRFRVFLRYKNYW